MKFDQEHINVAKDRFKESGKGPFYNGEQQWEFNIQNTQLFINAVWQGYLDMNRTLPHITANINDKVLVDLANTIQSYFLNSSSGYLHSEWCKDFIAGINAEYPCNARYGHAQKIVNMALKYLYCCDGAEEYLDKFNPCHMPLDKYTLLWLFTETGVLYQGWSYFDEGTYNKVQEDIKRILGSNIPEKELVIWDYFKNNNWYKHMKSIKEL